MPKKPRGSKTSGRVIPDARVAKLLSGRDPIRINFALEAWLAPGPRPERYSTVRTLLMDTFGISRATAERDIRDARLMNAEHTISNLPMMRAESSEQLQRIADKQEQSLPMASIAALREMHSINGLHVNVVSVGATSPEQQALIGALVMTPYQREQRIAKLRAESDRSATPAKAPDADE